MSWPTVAVDRMNSFNTGCFGPVGAMPPSFHYNFAPNTICNPVHGVPTAPFPYHHVPINRGPPPAAPNPQETISRLPKGFRLSLPVMFDSSGPRRPSSLASPPHVQFLQHRPVPPLPPLPPPPTPGNVYGAESLRSGEVFNKPTPPTRH